MISTDQIDDVAGKNVVGSDGSKIGKVGQVYLDDQTGQPEWATVATGMFGSNESFVPLQQADISGGNLAVPFGKDKVKGAPNVAADGHLSETEEADLYRYYGLDYAEPAAPVTKGRAVDTSAPQVDNAMTRSEEQLRVGTERREAGRARLRKYVVTEKVDTTVPVSHEETRITREPITDANRDAAMDGPEITEAVHEVTLTEERPVVAKETVPVERVRLDKETVFEQQQVSETVRKERIEADLGEDDPKGTPR